MTLPDSLIQACRNGLVDLYDWTRFEGVPDEVARTVLSAALQSGHVVLRDERDALYENAHRHWVRANEAEHKAARFRTALERIVEMTNLRNGLSHAIVVARAALQWRME